MAPDAKINQFFITSSSAPPWDLKAIISDIYLLLSRFSHVLINSCYRASNGLAG